MQSVPHERGSSMQQEPTNDTASAGAVYVQTNAAPNEVIAFRRADDGSLDRIGSVATGGEGDGTPHLQSQGSVTLTGDGQYLLVTNAASDDLSAVFVASAAVNSAGRSRAIGGRPPIMRALGWPIMRTLGSCMARTSRAVCAARSSSKCECTDATHQSKPLRKS